jgi:antitoxin VapB
MALSIKNDEADRLARDLAAVTGETLTDAVTIALRERLARERATSVAITVRRILRLTEEVQSLPVLDDRDHAEIVGYGEQGLPA